MLVCVQVVFPGSSLLFLILYYCECFKYQTHHHHPGSDSVLRCRAPLPVIANSLSYKRMEILSPMSCLV